MKRFCMAILIFVLAFAAPSAWAAPQNSMVGWEILDLTTAGLSATEFRDYFDWTYGFKVVVYGSTDDTITVTVMAADGVTTIYSGTTSSATSTEVLNLDTVPIPPDSTIAISGIGTGTANVYFTAAAF